jgi:hypothetical protein
LRRNVIKQNILLLLAKKKGVSFSYTFIKKWYSKFITKIVNTFQSIRQYIFYIIVLYSLVFIWYVNYSSFNKIYTFNYEGLFYFIIISILYFILFLSRSLLSIIINISILFFIITFWIINF